MCRRILSIAIRSWLVSNPTPSDSPSGCAPASFSFCPDGPDSLGLWLFFEAFAAVHRTSFVHRSRMPYRVMRFRFLPSTVRCRVHICLLFDCCDRTCAPLTHCTFRHARCSSFVAKSHSVDFVHHSAKESQNDLQRKGAHVPLTLAMSCCCRPEVQSVDG